MVKKNGWLLKQYWLVPLKYSENGLPHIWWISNEILYFMSILFLLLQILSTQIALEYSGGLLVTDFFFFTDYVSVERNAFQEINRIIWLKKGLE